VQLPEIDYQVEPEVAGPSEALLLAAGRIAEGVGDERDTRIDAVVLEPRAGAEPVSKHVPARQDELEGSIREGACAGRGARGVLGVGDGRPAEDHQECDCDAMSTYGQIH
jgi:hypothetical protein